MDVAKLIREHITHNPTSHFFDRDTLAFFGERISDMRVLKDTVPYERDGEKRNAYCLSSLQRNYPLGKRRAYHYFDTETFKEVLMP